MSNVYMGRAVNIIILRIILLVLGVSGTSIVLAETDGPLSWKPAAWGEPAVYQLEGGQSGSLKGPIIGENGLSEGLKKILSSNPEALKEAERTEAASYTVIAGWTVLLAGTLLQLKETQDQADDPLAESDSSKSLGLVIVGAIIAVIGTSNYKGHINSSIRMYNQGIKKTSRTSNNSSENAIQFGFNVRSDISRSSRAKYDDVAVLGTLNWQF